MTNTIPNVPRELKPCPFCGDIPSENSHALTDGGFKYGAIQCGCGALGPDVRTEYKDWPHWRDAAFAAWNERALLSAPSPAGVDGLEVRAYEHVLHMGLGQKECFFSEIEELPFGVRGEDFSATYDATSEPLCRLTDAQAIIDGLRGEVERLQRAEKNDAIAYKAALERQDELRTERDQQAQRIGELEGLLLRVQVSLSLDDTEWGYSGAEKYKLLADIRAALSAGKEGE